MDHKIEDHGVLVQNNKHMRSSEENFDIWDFSQSLINKKLHTLGKGGKKFFTIKAVQIDHLILNILQEEQGFKLISTYEIKQMIDKSISQSTIYNKVKKLEENGIILNYTINFCPKKIGFKGKFLIRIKPKDPSKYDKIAMIKETTKEDIRSRTPRTTVS